MAVDRVQMQIKTMNSKWPRAAKNCFIEVIFQTNVPNIYWLQQSANLLLFLVEYDTKIPLNFGQKKCDYQYSLITNKNNHELQP